MSGSSLRSVAWGWGVSGQSLRDAIFLFDLPYIQPFDLTLSAVATSADNALGIKQYCMRSLSGILYV